MTQDRTLSIDVPQMVGQVISIKGWYYTLRSLGVVNFLLVRDAWGIVQCVVSKEIVHQLRDIQVESVIEVNGQVVEAKQAPNGIELHDCKLTIITPVYHQIPFEINHPDIKANLDVFLNHAQLGYRQPKKQALLRLSMAITQGFRQVLTERNFTEIQTPKIVGSATEGGANIFEVDYFGQPAFLAQSPQLYKQMMVGVFERVFEVGPVFRAEPHNTSRHINEYVSLDVELGFIENHHSVMNIVSVLFQEMLAHLQKCCTKELELLDITMPKLPSTIPSLTFVEAQHIVKEYFFEDCSHEKDLSPQHERWLGQWAQEIHQSDFLFVTEFPMEKRPFYTYPNPKNNQYSNSFDLLFRGLELITGGQRLHRYQDYIEALADRNIDHQGFKAYLETFKYGMPPHGGFAIGLERFLLQLTQMSNIKEVRLFPRDRNRLTP